jgi:hypothetical protein
MWAVTNDDLDGAADAACDASRLPASEVTRTALTIDEMRAADDVFVDSTVREARRYDHGWEVTMASGWTFALADDRNPLAIEPIVGQRVRMYGEIGRPIHGVDIDGVNVYWLSPLEREAERAKMLAQIDRGRRERYARDRETNNAAVAALPSPLRKRMERLRMDRPDEDRLDEGYEIFCCTEAAVIAGIVNREKPMLLPEDGIKWFRNLPYDEQRAFGLSDGHSGNTFGGACSLAFGVLSGLEV